MIDQNGAQLLVKCLEQHNVKQIFAIPGAKIDAVFDALNDSEIRVIVCRHEQNAAFMAAAYGRVTGQPGVVLVTSGPGVSNLATGLLTATTEGDPLIAIGGNVSTHMQMKESHQNADNKLLLAPTCKSSVEVTAVDNIPEAVENAFRLAKAPRSGACFISLPQDITLNKTAIKPNSPSPSVHYGLARSASITQAQDLLKNARNPVILLGQEASRTVNTNAIRGFLKQYPLPVVSTYQAAGVISRDLLKCFAGRVGLFSNQPGDVLLNSADVVLTIGYNPVEYDPESWNKENNKQIIHLDYDPANIHLVYGPTVELLGDIADNLAQLANNFSEGFSRSIPEKVSHLQKEITDIIATGKDKSGELIHPLRFIYELQQLTDDDTMVISDIGTHYMWLARYYLVYEPHKLLFSNGQQTLGVALPWAIGHHYVNPNEKVISISGDGGFLFSATELETAVRENCNFVHCVWRDGNYNMVKEQQLMKYKRECAVKLGRVDIPLFAESFGAKGFLVEHSDSLADTLKEAMAVPGPALVEIPIDYSDNPGLFAMAGSNVGH